IMDIFRNRKDNSLRLVLDGIRRRKTWKEIRSQILSQNADAASEEEGVVLFPDQEEYRHMFGDHEEVVQLNVKINELGTPLNDEIHRSVLCGKAYGELSAP